MNKNIKTRNGFIHLYNPIKEGLGSYDVNYINAYKKIKYIYNRTDEKNNERHAA